MIDRKNKHGCYLNDEQKNLCSMLFSDNYKGSGKSRREFFIGYKDVPINVVVRSPFETMRYIDSTPEYEICYWAIALRFVTVVPVVEDVMAADGRSAQLLRFVPHESCIELWECWQRERLIQAGMPTVPVQIKELYPVDVEFQGVYKSLQQRQIEAGLIKSVGRILDI